MRAVVFEDDDEKWRTIEGALLERGVTSPMRVASLAEFARLRGAAIDLCVVDLRMPAVEGGEKRSAGIEILKMLEYAGFRKVPVLAISSFVEEAKHSRAEFAQYGCLIYDYDDSAGWRHALDIFIAQAHDQGRYDFAIFAALKKERDAYASILKPKATFRYGIDCWDCDLDGARGTIVLLPRPGLVNATSVVSRFLAQFSPKIVAMSGICAGVGDNASMGQLLITDVCWEYQSGKWLDDAFEAEPYQVSIPHKTRNGISQLIDDGTLIGRLEADFKGKTRPGEISNPKFAIFATGSAVIASEKRLDAVKVQHRKVSGIDMEIFGFHRGVELSGRDVHCVSAKVVVDKADHNKSDDIHEYGSFVSANFIRNAIAALLK
jgi:adenosylhomocysteine nucleosidase